MFEEDETNVLNSPPLVDLCLAVDFSCNSLSVSTTTNCNNSTQMYLIEMKQAGYAKSVNSA